MRQQMAWREHSTLTASTFHQEYMHSTAISEISYQCALLRFRPRLCKATWDNLIVFLRYINKIELNWIEMAIVNTCPVIGNTHTVGFKNDDTQVSPVPVHTYSLLPLFPVSCAGLWSVQTAWASVTWRSQTRAGTPASWTPPWTRTPPALRSL